MAFSRRHLDKTQFGEIAILGHKLRVQGNVGHARNRVAEFAQPFVGVDEFVVHAASRTGQLSDFRTVKYYQSASRLSPRRSPPARNARFLLTPALPAGVCLSRSRTARISSE